MTTGSLTMVKPFLAIYLMIYVSSFSAFKNKTLFHSRISDHYDSVVRQRSNSVLCMAGFFDFGNFFKRNEDEQDDEDEEGYVGSTIIFEIPGERLYLHKIFTFLNLKYIFSYLNMITTNCIKAKSLKVGGARLYLSLYLMGEQNTPEKKSWKVNQNGDGGIDLFYCDQTGALIFELTEDLISISRLGSAPSMQYLVNESVMLNGILDQLDEIAGDEMIDGADRLIILEKPGAIQSARDGLAFS